MAMKLEMNFQARQEVEAARISENEQQLALEEEALTILETRIRSQDEKLRAKIEQIAEEARTQVEEVEAEAKLLGVPAVNEMSSESVNKSVGGIYGCGGTGGTVGLAGCSRSPVRRRRCFGLPFLALFLRPFCRCFRPSELCPRSPKTPSGSRT